LKSLMKDVILAKGRKKQGNVKSCLKTTNNNHDDDIHHRPVVVVTKKPRLPRSSYRVLLRGQGGADDEQQQPVIVIRSRCIAFYENVHVIPSSSELELTEDLIQQLWFQDHEYQAIRSHTFALIKDIKDGKIRKSKYCTRGLEQHFQNPEQIMRRRLFALLSVLEEQNERTAPPRNSR